MHYCLFSKYFIFNYSNFRTLVFVTTKNSRISLVSIVVNILVFVFITRIFM